MEKSGNEVSDLSIFSRYVPSYDGMVDWLQTARKTVISESEDWNCGFGSFTTVQIQARTINPLGLFFQLSGEAVQSPVKDEDEDSGVSLPESKVQISHLPAL